MYTRAFPATKRRGEEWHIFAQNKAMYPEESARVLNAHHEQVRDVDTLPDGRKVVCYQWRTTLMPAPAFWYYVVEEE